MTTTATDLDTFTDEERALARAIPSVYVTQLAVARCLLRLERLERAAMTLYFCPRCERHIAQSECYEHNCGIGIGRVSPEHCGSVECGRCWRCTPGIPNPSAPSKVAASLPAEPKRTGPEVTDPCARCGTPRHLHPSYMLNCDGCHFPPMPEWRAAELAEQELQHPRGVEAGGGLDERVYDAMAVPAADRSDSLSMLRWHISHLWGTSQKDFARAMEPALDAATRERDELKAALRVEKACTQALAESNELLRAEADSSAGIASVVVEGKLELQQQRDAALARVAELETERNRSTCLTHLSHHDANCADCGWAHRCNMLRIERDKLSTDNARLQGELEALATAHAEAMRLLHDAYGDSLDACSNVQAALDAANTRAERMAAVVHYARLARQTLEAGDDGSPSSGAAVAMVVRARIAPALSALDAATSPVVSPPEPPGESR